MKFSTLAYLTDLMMTEADGASNNDADDDVCDRLEATLKQLENAYTPALRGGLDEDERVDVDLDEEDVATLSDSLGWRYDVTHDPYVGDDPDYDDERQNIRDAIDALDLHEEFAHCMAI